MTFILPARQWTGGGPTSTGVLHGVLRKRSNISPGTCCRRLRSAEVPSGRGPAGACCRSKGLCRGWDRPERRTEEQSGRVVAMGPQPRVHPSGVRTWVEEHEPEEGPADAWPAELGGVIKMEGGRLEREIEMKKKHCRGGGEIK
uniref:SCAN box domain-containing protein n=1 Tax=Oryzias latipes TaxID=8090 RepID=A0A3B3I4L0_ORYLA